MIFWVSHSGDWPFLYAKNAKNKGEENKNDYKNEKGW